MSASVCKSPGHLLLISSPNASSLPRTPTHFPKALSADYASWCRAFDREALSAAAFVAEADRLRAENGLGKMHKRKGSYGGIRLVTSS